MILQRKDRKNAEKKKKSTKKGGFQV